MTDESNNKYRVICGLENIDRQQWADFVAHHPHGTIFQTPEYYEIHQGVKGFLPFVIALFDSTDSMVGVMLVIIHQVYGGLLGTLTSRAVIAGGPLVKNDDPELASAILQAFVANRQVRVVYSQFRNLFELGAMKSAFSNAGAVYEDHLNILIDLTQTEEELWKGVKSRKRNNIRQAQRKGLTVRRIVSEAEAAESFAILTEVYKRAKLPLADRQLFMNAFRLMHDNGMLRIYGTFCDEKLAGSMFVLAYNGRFYDWYAGSFRKYYSFNPNDILPWEIFRIAQAEGIPLFDFGGAGKPGVPYGVRDYKIQFGGKLVDFGRYELPHNKLVFGMMKVAFRLWQRLH
jgi:lipid II:glycine glycyltransferase (peptidoglycan interpeptide bridge formation enzyme)